MAIAPELLARYDKYAAAKREAKKKNTFSTQMLVLNAIEQADTNCFCLLDSGANVLVLPLRDAMKGTDAQCTVPGGGVVPGHVVQVIRLGTEDHHAVAIEGASPLIPLSWLVLLAGWVYLPVAKGEKMHAEVESSQGARHVDRRSKMHCLEQGTFMLVLQDVWKIAPLTAA